MNLENCILTYSGRYVNLLKPDPTTIHITDIAHALSQINRFGGHTRRFYSVAQHCVLASHLVPLKYRLHALLHDAAEAYFGDMVQPLKRLDGSAQYRTWESMMQAEIFDRFGLGMEQSDECKACIQEADLIMLATERRDLMPPDATPWAILEGVKPRNGNISPVSSHLAESMYLSRFKELAGVL
ncbi:metal-dependent phosphohydrolase [Noviherbaspirillum denitrificans]|uniref:Phosphohydrolase n=1 Tax=Noviherbaspirillum denitrificans TaxID=1968433 RepID=A0A254T9T7_9BURK|nr:metal-dependent phosphohydrolase [Noviherbaspirillum denitrificans]OWW18430.1 hypothetical protein AYR66_01115 [Noviherbaspirillum denitrificans]OWW19394.1 hypothetical protein AYR66_07600 [Noviherbaspirillum denitrificans]